MSQTTVALTYDKLVNRIVPGPQSLSYFVPLVILPIAFSIPPWTVSKQTICVVALPIITASLAHAWTVMGGIDVISFDMLLHSYHLLLFNNPRRDFRRVLEGPETATAEKNKTPVPGSRVRDDESTTPQYVEQSYPANWNERLPWIGTLLISMRFVDWKIGSPSHDSKQPARCPDPPSHLRFILKAILRTLSGYVVMDLTSAWTQQDPYFKTFGMSVDSPLPHDDLLGLLPPRLIRCTIMALQVWATVGQQFQLPCILPVALHWAGYLPDAWSPHLWPTFFGSFRAMFTSLSLGAVRNFWGRYWHQTLRYYCSSPGVWLADLMHLPRRSHSRYFLLSVATFVFSGIVHIGLVPPEPMFATKTASQIRWLILSFFWLQPVGFAFEMAVSAGLRRFGTHKSIFVTLNILWFTAWCCFVLPLLGEAGRNLGYWRVWPVPFSLWRGITTGRWLTWF
ncbi:unnamed protein product [Aureobasidium vineae]|uniref:Wax synthase domain-containing protein n=1 Tax=Aureobasidium vineae TaxID=2773715 RepID=A0A9N8JYD3_9PEZI|nr:unnamed protein product [Aureobasidium vineae]